MTTNSNCGSRTAFGNSFNMRRTRWLIGAAFVVGDLLAGTLVQAQQSLPAVTVDAPVQRARPARVAAAARSAQRAAARRAASRNPTPAAPTPSERAVAAAAARYEQILGYRAMPSATTLRGATNPLDSAQIVNVVPQQVISDQRPRNLDDALINVSGITQTNTLAGNLDAVMRRGFGDNQDGSIMRNGMPIFQGRAFNDAVESVEVLKGPASLLYGIQDPGGVINTISKRPELYQHGSITLGGSTYGSKGGGGVTADITGPIGTDGLAYRIIASKSNEDYWRNFGTHQSMLIAPSLAWYGDNTTVHFNYEHRDYSDPFDRGIALNGKTLRPYDGIPITRRFDEPYNILWGSSDLVQASVDHRINDNWKLYAGYTYNKDLYSANQLRITAAPASGVITRKNDGNYDAMAEVSYGTSYMQGTVWLGDFKNDVVFGGDAEYRVIYRKDLMRGPNSTFNLYNPVYGILTPGQNISPPDSDQTDKLGQRSMFVQDTFHVTNWLSLVGGLRWMEWEQLAGKGRPFVINTNTTGDKVLPVGGVILKLNEQVSLYASYTESLKPNWSIAPLDGGTVITSAMAPEEGTSVETGVKFDINKRLSGSLAFYDIEKKNVRTSELDLTTGVTTIRTAGKVRSRGIEFDVTGRLTDNWSAIATYAYTDARVTEDPLLLGKRLQNVALNTASLFLTYDFGTLLPGKLRVGAGARFVGDRPGEADESFYMPSYTVADAFATYDTTYNNVPVTYQFNIKNMFDNIYYPSAVNRLNVAVGDARRFSLAATVKF